ncbi:MAG: ABC transporter permease [bacterium JZ-2024 1]
MVRKEFRQLRRDPTTIVIAIMIPAIQLTILGYAIRTDIRNVGLVVGDLRGTEASRRLVAATLNTGVFQYRGAVASYGDAYDAIQSGFARAALLIPPDFTDRPVPGKSSTVQVLVDGADSTTANYVVATMDGVVAAFQAPESSAVLNPFTSSILVQPRILFNPDLRSSVYFVPALVVLILHLPLLILTSLSIVRERVEGTLEQLIVTPISRTSLMLGKLVPFFIIGIVAGTIILLVMVFVFRVPIRGNLAILGVTLIVWIATSLALGLLISTFARTQLQAVLISILVVVPSILLSGFMFPRESMPAPVYPITLVLPMTYAVAVVRGLVIRGASPLALFPHISVLVAFCVSMIALATLRFQKRLR